MSVIAHATLEHAMTFVAKTGSGHELRMDAGEKAGGHDSAARPGELPFAGLAGCTGIDVIGMLRKMRQEPETFSVEIEGIEKSAEYPKRWKHIRVVFYVSGDVEPKKLTKAINLSREKYCSVSANMKQNVQMDYAFELNGRMQEINENADSE